MTNPQRAINWIRDRVSFPCYIQPKIDGVRGGQYAPGEFTGRSLEPFANKQLTSFWSHRNFCWLDGELVLAGEPWTAERLCNQVTSMTNTIAGHAGVSGLVVFDWLEDLSLPYEKRLVLANKRVKTLQNSYGNRVQIIENYIARDLEEVLEFHASFLERGLEGTILRDYKQAGKEGASSKTTMHLWRIKDFIDFEVRVRKILPALENTNEQVMNKLGRMERSTHKANKIPKSMVGMLQGEVLKDVVHEGKLLFKKGLLVDISPGRMTHDFRKAAWANPSLILDPISKVKTFPIGVKDKPRMPTWESFRSKADM